MATSKTQSEGFRAQTLTYIRAHPGVSSLDLRAIAPQFGTDAERMSKTLWAMTACGLIVQRPLDPSKKVGTVQYWDPEAAPADMKAQVKMARGLQATGLTMTEYRKQQQGGTVVAKKASTKSNVEQALAEAKSSRKKAEPVPGKSKVAKAKPAERHDVTVVSEQQAAPASVRKTRGPGKKTLERAAVPAQESATPVAPVVPPVAAPIVTPVSLEHLPAEMQPSLFEEPQRQRKAIRTAQSAKPATPVTQQPAAQQPVTLPFTPALDMDTLASALQPFAGALSDMLANMVIGQTLQKVQQGLGGLSMALAQGAPQLATPPVPAAPPSQNALNVLTAIQQPVAAPQEATAQPAVPQSMAAPAAEPAAVATSERRTTEEAHASEQTLDDATNAAEMQAAPRPVLHTPPAREVAPKKPKILVVGLLPNQAGIVQSEFHEAFDVRFAESDTPTKRLESMASDCDRVMLMTNFISHSTQDAVKKHPGFERIQGGLTKVKDRFTELFIASEEAV